MTVNHWGNPKKGSIIHNGIEVKKFQKLHPDIEKIKNNFDRIFVCSASWHRQKRLKENILFYKSVKKEKDVLLVLGKNPDYIEQDNNIFYLGHLPHEICLQIYSIADWFLHLAWLDHCPNVVIEAMSQGCPVICTDMGGTKEIVKNNGIVLAEDNPYNFELTDYDKPYELNIDPSAFTLDKKDVLFDLNIEKIANQYIEVFNESLCSSA
jgi:glycosyltransferase involved in cell wall biosynthesis